MLPAGAVRVVSASNWEDRFNMGNMSASNNTDGSTSLSFTPANTNKRINTKVSQKLNGLYISISNVNYSGAGLPIMITPTRGGWFDGAGLQYVATSTAAVWYRGSGGTAFKSLLIKEISIMLPTTQNRGYSFIFTNRRMARLNIS